MGELREAEAAEWRLIEEMRQMGQASLAAWDQGRVSQATAECGLKDSVWREGKKLRWHTPSVPSVSKNLSCVAVAKGSLRSRVAPTFITAV